MYHWVETTWRFVYVAAGSGDKDLEECIEVLKGGVKDEVQGIATQSGPSQNTMRNFRIQQLVAETLMVEDECPDQRAHPISMRCFSS